MKMATSASPMNKFERDSPIRNKRREEELSSDKSATVDPGVSCYNDEEAEQDGRSVLVKFNPKTRRNKRFYVNQLRRRHRRPLRPIVFNGTFPIDRPISSRFDESEEIRFLQEEAEEDDEAEFVDDGSRNGVINYGKCSFERYGLTQRRQRRCSMDKYMETFDVD